MTTPTSENPVKLFYSYSHKDETLRDELETHLAMLRREGQIESWHDRRISAGREWEGSIDEHLNLADVILLLVSPDFLASDYCYDIEVRRAMERHQAGEARVIPIILRPCDWLRSPFGKLQALPKDALPITRWINQDEAFVNIVQGLRLLFDQPPSSHQRILHKVKKIVVKNSDVMDFPCDALVLKYAQNFYGADAKVAEALTEESSQKSNLTPPPGESVLLPTKGLIAAGHVLFLGVGDLYEFDYEQIREFTIHSMRILAEQMPNAMHVAMTIHGVGYGLDERESFLSLIAGLLHAFKDGAVPASLERVTIVEVNRGRAERLSQILEEILPSKTSSRKLNKVSLPKSITEAGLKSNIKQHVFVAMPFGDDMEDTYVFGIQGPVNAAGLLCERVDMVTFTGDILDRIKSRIETATLVIADLTGANPNVYLEVGYAWGKNRPTLLLTKKSDELKFDVRGQRCIVYKNIADLARKLEMDIAALNKTS